MSSTGSSAALPPSLTDSQLARMDRLTREGIEERLKVLDGVQASLWRCVEELTKMKSVLPPQVAVEAVEDAANRQGKGKGRA